MVQDQALKKELADEAMVGIGNQFRTKDCSALAVFLSDLEAGKRIQRILKLEKDWGKRHPNYMAVLPLTTSFILGEGHAATLLKQVSTSVISNMHPMPTIEPIQSWSYKNTALAAQSYLLAAESHNLATSIMEGYDARRAKDVLQVPDRYGIPMMVATGYEYEEVTEDMLTPRLDLDEVVFGNSFGAPFQEDEDDDTAESA